MGYGVAAVQLIAGNPDHAKRAAATSTNAIVTTGGTVLGSMAGAAAGVATGPPSIFVRAVAGGSFCNPVRSFRSSTELVLLSA